MTQQHVVPAELASRMFDSEPVEFSGGEIRRGSIRQLRSITWLVGPIVCGACESFVKAGNQCIDTEGRRWVSGKSVARYEPFTCPDCNGNGYPPRVEIVSQTCVREECDDDRCRTVHGTVELGAPVPVVQFVFGNEALSEGVPQVVIHENGVDVSFWDGAGGIDLLTGAIGPCENGDTAYPIGIS